MSGSVEIRVRNFSGVITCHMDDEERPEGMVVIEKFEPDEIYVRGGIGECTTILRKMEEEPEWVEVIKDRIFMTQLSCRDVVLQYDQYRSVLTFVGPGNEETQAQFSDHQSTYEQVCRYADQEIIAGIYKPREMRQSAENLYVNPDRMSFGYPSDHSSP
ncbi:hypothetical protein FOZ63_018100 [Perkinsus olseni]|uniref:Uncharacterized protein n=1 Tax=Perkinsus olseni TaxID=32597 RepID=A0A7J6QRR4_PEROL|nr:hypothetical protein FOZ63_018100 [Perkinsus olseni]